MSNKIVNWENVFNHTSEFQSRKPAKWAFIEEFFDRKFYEKLHNSYPEWDDTWGKKTGFDKNSNYKMWNDKEPNDILPCIYCVTTIIAPPHPGIAPRKEAIGT